MALVVKDDNIDTHQGLIKNNWNNVGLLNYFNKRYLLTLSM